MQDANKDLHETHEMVNHGRLKAFQMLHLHVQDKQASPIYRLQEKRYK